MPASEAQKERPRVFAREVIANKIGKNRFSRTEKDIALSLNYAKETADNTPVIKKTKAFQQEYAKQEKSILEQLEKERQRLLDSLTISSLKGVKYNQKIEALKTLNHDIQLLGGKDTERIGDKVGDELADILKDLREARGMPRLTQGNTE